MATKTADLSRCHENLTSTPDSMLNTSHKTSSLGDNAQPITTRSICPIPYPAPIGFCRRGNVMMRIYSGVALVRLHSVWLRIVYIHAMVWLVTCCFVSDVVGSVVARLEFPRVSCRTWESHTWSAAPRVSFVGLRRARGTERNGRV